MYLYSTLGIEMCGFWYSRKKFASGLACFCGDGQCTKAQARCGCIHGGRERINDQSLSCRARICTVFKRAIAVLPNICRCQARARESLSACCPTQRIHDPRRGYSVATACLSVTLGKPRPDVGVSCILIHLMRMRLPHVSRHASENNLHATMLSPILPLSHPPTLPLTQSLQLTHSPIHPLFHSLTLACSVAPALSPHVSRRAGENKPQGSFEYKNPQPSRGQETPRI